VRDGVRPQWRDDWKVCVIPRRFGSRSSKRIFNSPFAIGYRRCQVCHALSLVSGRAGTIVIGKNCDSTAEYQLESNFRYSNPCSGPQSPATNRTFCRQRLPCLSPMRCTVLPRQEKRMGLRAGRHTSAHSYEQESHRHEAVHFCRREKKSLRKINHFLR
jgi:hypothetical protein